MTSGRLSVSFLMPVYNAGRTVLSAVRSAFFQRGVPPEALEVVAVDDGSTDGSLALLRELAAREPRLRVEAAPHQGLVAALARGQALCRGEFIARLDADDLARPDRVAEQLRLMRGEPRLGLVGCRVRYFPRKILLTGLTHYEDWLNSLLAEGDSPAESHARLARELFVECPLAHPTFFLRGAALEQVGGYRDFAGHPEDYDLLLRLVAEGWWLGGVPRVLHCWREHPGRASRTDPRYCEESFRALKLHWLLRLRLEGGRRPVSICGAGPVGKQWLKVLQAAGVEVRYLLEVNPRKLGKRIHGVPVIRAEELADQPREPGLILGAVGQKGGRESTRRSLDPLGLREGEDYLLLA